MTMQDAGHVTKDYWGGGGRDVSALFLCDDCLAPSIGTAFHESAASSTDVTSWIRTIAQIGAQIGRVKIEWLPVRAAGKDFPDVPDKIAATASEAHSCLSIEAARGAVGLARAVIESIAKDQDVDKGQIGQKIEKLAEQGTITKGMKDTADEIRLHGNEVLHGDLVDEPLTTDDASDVLGLMDEIIEHVYQRPRRLEKIREARLARKAANNDE